MRRSIPPSSSKTQVRRAEVHPRKTRSHGHDQGLSPLCQVHHALRCSYIIGCIHLPLLSGMPRTTDSEMGCTPTHAQYRSLNGTPIRSVHTPRTHWWCILRPPLQPAVGNKRGTPDHAAAQGSGLQKPQDHPPAVQRPDSICSPVPVPRPEGEASRNPSISLDRDLIGRISKVQTERAVLPLGGISCLLRTT